jgi:RNA polymerase sigma-B factor
MADRRDTGAATEPSEVAARTMELFEQLGQDPSAREQLVKQYYGLAEYLARRFAGRGESIEDLVQVASIGLIKAVDRFDPHREVQFSTYATATIVGELKRHFRDKGWALRVPRRLQENGLVVNRAMSEMNKELGRSPTMPELSRRTGFSREEVLEAIEALQAYTTSSLDAPHDDDLTSDRLASVDESLEILDRWADLSPHLRQLPARERRIIHMRFFQGLTQAEIAEEIGISQMHVSRLLSSTLERLRKAAGPDA